MKPIYTPKGRANEYCEFAMNIYDTCNHGCFYCWSRMMYERFHGKGSFDKIPEPRPGLLEAMQKQLASNQYEGKLIHLCFTCDPYPAPPVDTTITREVIKAIKAAGAHVQILTKGGRRAERDFDLLDGEDWFGVTDTGGGFEKEPNASHAFERVDSLKYAHERGIRTWMSFEPVYIPGRVYNAFWELRFVDLFRIGKLNYYPSSINWAAFGHECERLAKEYGRNVYIKEDLRREMEAAREDERKEQHDAPSGEKENENV